MRVKPIDINSSLWDCEVRTDPQSHPPTPTLLQLGFRLISGLQKKEAELIAAERARKGRYNSLKELWLRSKVRISTLKRLANADAFSSLGLTRQQALWELARYREELPLFAPLTEPEAFAPLPNLTRHQIVLADCAHTGFSLKAHPLSFLRRSLTDLGVTLAADLRSELNFPMKKKVRVAGLILVRQRPGTAKGVVFLTLEDETGFINLIIPSQLFQTQHREICESTAILAEGHIERQADVVYIKTEQVRDISEALFGLDSKSRDFH